MGFPGGWWHPALVPFSLGFSFWARNVPVRQIVLTQLIRVNKLLPRKDFPAV